MKFFVSKMPRTAMVLAVAVLAAGCSTLAPSAAPVPQLPAHFAQAQGLPTGEAPTADGWAAFGDTVLTQLVQRGLAANLDLQQAAERVQRSRALADAGRAALGPAGGLNFGLQAQQASASEAPGMSRDQRRGEQAAAGLGLAWEIDLFGRLRHQAGAAQARLQVSDTEAEALRLAVAAEIAQAWFAHAGARELQQLTREVIQNQRRTLQLVQRRGAVGYSAPLDEARARAELAAAEAMAPQHEAAATVAAHRIAVLLGESPSGFTLPAAQAVNPAMVPLTVPEPSRWLAARPDVRGAEAGLRASALDVQAIRAEFMPRVSISGLLGFVAGSATGLGAAGSVSWFVAPTVSLPLFDRARIEARLAGAQAQQREALLAYRQRVLLALEDVENALAVVRHGQQSLAAQQQRSQHAVAAEGLARRRFEAGASDLLELLDAQRGAQQARIALAASLTRQRQQIVSLMRAFGAVGRPADNLAAVAPGA